LAAATCIIISSLVAFLGSSTEAAMFYDVAGVNTVSEGCGKSLHANFAMNSAV
jgi:hypothetical protein